MTPQPYRAPGDSLEGLKPVTVYGVRTCALPGCENPAKMGRNGLGDFCSVQCKNEFHVQADRLGAALLRQVKAGAYASQVFERLKKNASKWVDRPFTPPYRDVIRRLRRKGAQIETRQVRDGLRLKYQDRMTV